MLFMTLAVAPAQLPAIVHHPTEEQRKEDK
jgi:hypothetical protein